MQYPKVFNDNKSWLASEVQPAKRLVEESGSESDAGKTNLIINYLPPDMTEHELFEIFCKIGDVAKLKIVRNRSTGQSLGYGFVEFKNAGAARIARFMFDRHVVRGKSLKVTFARPRSEDIVNANLYVRHLPRDVDEEKLTTLFGCYGTIIEAKVLRCKYTGNTRGAGFVRFDQRLAAEVAMKALDNYVLKDATEPISVQFATVPMNSPLHKRFSFSPSDNAAKRQIDSETQMPAMRIQQPNPFPRPIQREMELEIEQTAMRNREPNPVPRPIKREMEPEIEQTAMRNREPNPVPRPIKREIKPQLEQTSDRRHPIPPVMKRRMEPEIQQPISFPPLVKRQKSNIQQRQTDPEIQQRQMDLEIQHRQINPEIQQYAKRSQALYPNPRFVKRPMESEVEQIAKRACGFVDFHK